MTAARDLTAERLRQVLSYAEDGHLYWRLAVGSRARVGERAGSLGFNGYWSIRVDKKLYYEHRLVWLWHHGAFPDGALDHISGDFWDNRIENLRVATASENGANARLSCRNSSGAKGVSWNKRLGKWHAYIGARGRRKHLGFFSNQGDASTAYRMAAEQLYGDFARAERSTS